MREDVASPAPTRPILRQDGVLKTPLEAEVDLRRAALAWARTGSEVEGAELLHQALEFARSCGWKEPLPKPDLRPRCTCEPEVGGRMRCPRCGGWPSRTFD